MWNSWYNKNKVSETCEEGFDFIPLIFSAYNKNIVYYSIIIYL